MIIPLQIICASFCWQQNVFICHCCLLSKTTSVNPNVVCLYLFPCTSKHSKLHGFQAITTSALLKCCKLNFLKFSIQFVLVETGESRWHISSQDSYTPSVGISMPSQSSFNKFVLQPMNDETLGIVLPKSPCTNSVT